MKIGILTLPLHNNYGGLLQAWALSTFLKSMGHDVIILNRIKSEPYIKSFAKPFAEIKKYVRVSLYRLSSGKIRINSLFTTEEKNYIFHNTSRFIEDKFSMSSPISSTKMLKRYVSNSSFDVIIVGSDQCWRPGYCPNIYDFFLGFDTNSKFKRIAYAPSFGVDDWGFSDEETKRCKELFLKFDAVSVRESSAVSLCEKYFDRTPEHVIDPTMLLDRVEYENLACYCNTAITGGLYCYILDRTESTNRVISHIADKLKLRTYYCMPKLSSTLSNYLLSPEDCIIPSVEQWVQSFAKASMVICDSFHGCVFSIIFNRSFWVLGNKDRGMARFSSLLSTFKLENRLIEVDNLSSIDLNAPIDWGCVNSILSSERHKAVNFLVDALK